MIPFKIAIELKAPPGSRFLHSHPIIQFLLPGLRLPQFILISSCLALLNILLDRLLDMRFLLLLRIFHSSQVQFLIPYGSVVNIEIAAEISELAIAEDDEFLADCVDEIPVMRDKDDGWWVGAGFAELEEVALQPDDAEEIEKVGGFVEDEDIGWLEEAGGEIGAHSPST